MSSLTVSAGAPSAGEWQGVFDAAASVLECRHSGAGIVLKGRLAFVAERGGQAAAWTVQPARDSVPGRLALVDEQNDVQGYVTLQADGNRLDLTAIHRPPRNDAGELRFEPVCALGPDAFACRTRVPSGGAVVQMASGPADSRLNDALFDPDRDLLVRFGGRQVAIATAIEAGRPPSFRVTLTARPESSAASSISLEVLEGYYRKRYVPRYRRIDRRRCPSPPTGWMSWNAYFDTAGENENLAEARVGAKCLRPFGLEIWSIESWQENSDRLPVSDFHNLSLEASRTQFPHGLKWLAERIRELGFRPGIWTVPFGTGDRRWYEERRAWFLHHPDGRPMKNWCGRYVLDPSQPEVRRHMEETHRTMSAEWGYEFFKIDGMSGRAAHYSAHFFERPEVRAAFQNRDEDPYPLCIEALRQGIGPDRVFLACQGHYTGPEAAYADAARLGADIVHPGQPPHWENYLDQARTTLAQLFVHGLVWYNDPDTLLVGEVAPLGVARIAATVVGLPGQVTFFGDRLAELPPQRMRLLQQVLPVCAVRPLDLLPLHELKPVWDLKVRRPFAAWDVVSVFNWETAPRTRKLDFAELGLEKDREYLVYEFWSGTFLGGKRGGLEIELEPRSNVLLAIHQRLDRPQLLSTDRHLGQGAVEWTDGSWDAERGELRCRFDLVGDDPLTAAIHVPAAYAFAQAASEGAEVLETSNAPPLLKVRLRRAENGEAWLSLRFGKP